MKMRKYICGILGLLMIASISAMVLADSADVTTRWIVPADTTIGISYPNGETLIEFDASSQNFSDLEASSQTGALAALRITNNGNTAVQIEARWTADYPSGVKFVNISIDDATNSTFRSYWDTNETTNQTWVASLDVDASEDFWFWSTGWGVAETTGVDKTLKIYSTNV